MLQHREVGHDDAQPALPRAHARTRVRARTHTRAHVRTQRPPQTSISSHQLTPAEAVELLETRRGAGGGEHLAGHPV